MRRLLLSAAALVAGAGFALAQETLSGDTSLRRVQFRNGNVIECRIESAGDRELTINVRGKRFHVQRDDVVSVETLKPPSTPENARALPAIPPASASPSKGKTPPLDPAVRANVDRILAQFTDASGPVKEQLTRDLASSPGIGAYLASQLDRCSDESLPFVSRAISDLQEEAAAPYVAACLDSNRAPLVCAALGVISRCETRGSIVLVQRFLSDSRPSVRAAAIQALRLLGDDRSLPDIAQEMGSKDAVVRVAAINACLDLGRRFGKMDLVVGQLKSGILREEGPVLEDLLEAAGRSGSPELVEPMIRCLRDADPAIRMKAVSGLAQNRSSAGTQALVQRLSVDDSVAVRIQLARAAAALRTPDAISPLIDNLRDRDEALVRECRRALQTITKQDHGDQYNSWALWWEKARRG